MTSLRRLRQTLVYLQICSSWCMQCACSLPVIVTQYHNTWMLQEGATDKLDTLDD